MWRIFGLSCLLLGLVSCTPSSQPKVVQPGTGRLVRWSDQAADSPKKIIFIPGCVTTSDPNGLNPTELEDYFDIKVDNFDQLGQSMFGAPTSALVEYWFYGYYPNQDIAKIADDAYAAIEANRQLSDNCIIAVVAHSEGAVVGWILDQRRECLAGGALLGGPILSTPIAHKDVRDKAVKKTFPVLHDRLIPLFDGFAMGTEQLTVSYLESGEPKGRIKLFAGRIKSPSIGFWARNINLVDALLAERGFMGGIQDNRQFAQLGATIIAQSEWGGKTDPSNRWSDGLVSGSSATLNGQVTNQVFDDYDHWDLVAGKGDLTLDRAILEWLDEVLQLSPRWVESDLPETPDIIELPSVAKDAWPWAHLAYIDRGGRLIVTNSDWDRSWMVPVVGRAGNPQFSTNGDCLVFDVIDRGQTNIYVWSGAGVQQVTFDGKSSAPSWSPNERWLTYQSDSSLVTHRLTEDQRQVVATGVNLIAPPVWTKSGLNGRIYWVNDQRELRWVSPRQRGTSATNLVQSGCSRPFLVRGAVGGMVVIDQTTDNSQRVTVVTGLLSDRLSVELCYDPASWNIAQDDGEFLLRLNQPFKFTEAVFDAEYWHLYLVGEFGGSLGVYLFDVQEFLDSTTANPKLDDFFRLVCADANQLDVRPPAQ